MITGFEDITSEITQEEKKILLPYIANLFKNGKENAITSGEIIEVINRNLHLKTNGARVRKIIHVIRLTSYVSRLIASSKGYYISDNKDEVNNYIESLKQRANQIWQIHNQLKKDIAENPKQKTLF